MMHTLKLNISDSLYLDVLSYLHKLPPSELSIEEIVIKPDFIVNSIEDAKQRIEKAEINGNYISHEMLCDDMNLFIKTL